MDDVEDVWKAMSDNGTTRRSANFRGMGMHCIVWGDDRVGAARLVLTLYYSSRWPRDVRAQGFQHRSDIADNALARWFTAYAGSIYADIPAVLQRFNSKPVTRPEHTVALEANIWRCSRPGCDRLFHWHVQQSRLLC